MPKTVVIDVVGLTARLIGDHTPFIKNWTKGGQLTKVKPLIPAVTCSAQATYLTGKLPSEHGIVGNGWYFKDELEIKFWRQSNHLVQAPKIWEVVREQRPEFTCSKMFWWYNMYSSADYSVTPRPNYLADGRKIPDVYSYPANLRDNLQKELGQFPLFNFWGPNTKIKSSKWIADASILTDQWHSADLTLIYLPHLDYNLQRYGHDHPSIPKDLQEIDAVCKELIEYFEGVGAQVILLSEYGITDVHRPIHLNRIFREQSWLGIRREQSWELLDAGASQVFAVADHQIAHIYVNDSSKLSEARKVLEQVEGIEAIYGPEEKALIGMDHTRAGDLIAIADKDSWFTYYYWLDDQKAPDFARIVDIHRKPGYDPVEMFINPKIPFPVPYIVWKLLKKKLGFRYLMDVIPLDASLVKGSHGRVPDADLDYPVFITQHKMENEETIDAIQVYNLILQHL